MKTWSLEAFYHTVLNVTDLDASIAFYSRLGFELLEDRRDTSWPDFVAKNFGLHRAQGKGALMAVSSDYQATMIDLIEWIEPKMPMEPPSSTNGDRIPRIIALRVKNIEAAFAELEKDGVEFTNGLVGPFEQYGVVGVACCRDPDNTIVELIELKPGLRHSQTKPFEK